MTRLLLIIGLAGLFTQCQSSDTVSLLQGDWKTDSAYSFYNGFGYTRFDFSDEPIKHFLPEGRLVMTKKQETRQFSYRIMQGDTLIFQTADSIVFEKFHILELKENQLVIRKELAPLFKSKDQVRYEIRYLSKMK